MGFFVYSRELPFPKNFTTRPSHFFQLYIKFPLHSVDESRSETRDEVTRAETTRFSSSDNPV